VSTPSAPLSAVLSQSEEARDEALAEFEKARQSLDGARAQLQSLHDFRQQYQTRWQSQFSRSGGVEIMRCYNEFMDRMSEAEAEQQRRVEHCKVTLERCRLHLMERERRVAAVSTLMDRRAREVQRAENRKDQKATDEIAARLGGSSQAGVSTFALASGSSPAGHTV
jgi:flagellar protein FliJ